MDITNAYVMSVLTRITDHIQISKDKELPGIFPTKAKYVGITAGSMRMTPEDEKAMWATEKDLMQRWEAAPSVFKMIEEAEDGTVCLIIWPESLWHWKTLHGHIYNELHQSNDK